MRASHGRVSRRYDSLARELMTRRSVGVAKLKKGVRWMSWHREATKDAAACDKPREVGKRTLIRGSPNAETRLGNPQSSLPERIGEWKRTRGTETSQYPQEQKETSIP